MKDRPSVPLRDFIVREAHAHLMFHGLISVLVSGLLVTFGLAIFGRVMTDRALEATEHALRKSVLLGDRFETRILLDSLVKAELVSNVSVTDGAGVVVAESDQSNHGGFPSFTGKFLGFSRPIFRQGAFSGEPIATVNGVVRIGLRAFFAGLLAVLLLGVLMWQVLLFHVKRVAQRIAVPMSRLPAAVAGEEGSTGVLELDSIVSRLSVYHRRELEWAIEKDRLHRAEQLAHDIRSPLAALRVVHAMASDLTGEYKELIVSAVDRISSIARDILLERKLAKQVLNGRSRISLSTVAQQVISLKKAELGSTEVRIDLICPAAVVVSVPLSELEIFRILSNLVNNSVESLERSGRVEVHVTNDDGLVSIQVKDTGTGMDASFVRKILSEDSESISTKPSGNGLGLSYVIRTFRGIGGEVKIDSHLSQGTSITLLFAKDAGPMEGRKAEQFEAVLN